MGEAKHMQSGNARQRVGKDCMALLTMARNLKSQIVCFWNFAFNVFVLLLASDNRNCRGNTVDKGGTAVLTHPPSAPVMPARQGELYFLVH